MKQSFAFAMQKGGVGKTTTTLNVGAYLAKKGKKVLLVDLDPQAHLTQGLGYVPDKLEYSVYEVLLNPEQGIAFATIPTHVSADLDLVPSSLDLAGAELELAGKVGRESLLQEALEKAYDHYDYILIDAPPNLGLFTLNALTAASKVIVPVQVQVYAFKALPQLEKTIALVRKINRQLILGGIICTMYDRRTNLSPVVEKQIRDKYEDLVFSTVIPLNTKLAEAPAAGKPISMYEPHSPGAEAYMKLTEELEARYDE